MDINLKGKRILVTGAGRGIGQAIAKGMLESGAVVALHYHRSLTGIEELQQRFKEKAIPVSGDLNQPNDSQAIYESAIASMGGLDVLVNNAGIAIHSSLTKVDQDWLSDWQATLQVNLISAALLCKRAIQTFSNQEGGKIINITSRAAFRGDTSDYWAYAASKGGMVSLTRTIARNFGKQNIMSFNLAPGFDKTDMAKDFSDEYGEEILLNDIALSQLTAPADLVPMIILLASGLADHATGTTIDFNAGSYVH